MEIKSILEYKEDLLYQSVNQQGHKVMVDMRKDGTKEAFAPVEMLLSALSGCLSVDVVLILKKRRKTILDFKVEVTGERADEHPKYLKKAHCHFIITSPDILVDEVDKYVKTTLEKYCSVASSLKTQITYSIEIVKGS